MYFLWHTKTWNTDRQYNIGGHFINILGMFNKFHQLEHPNSALVQDLRGFGNPKGHSL